MIPYSVQPRDRIFVKGYEFLPFPRNMGKNISKTLSSKYSQKLLDHAEKFATDSLKTNSKRVNQKSSEAIGDLIGSKIVDKITRVSKTLPQNNAVTNEEEILRERYISLQKKDRKLLKI